MKTDTKKSNILLNFFHVLNDGLQASFLLLFPFIAKDLHISLTQVGFLGAVVNALSIVFALPAGYFAVKFGGLRMLLVALFFSGLGFLAAGISPFFLFLIPAFFVGGVGYGLFHPIAFALVARGVEKEKRGKAMGNFTAIGDVGRIGISTILTFVIVIVGWRATSVSYGLLVWCIGIILFLFLLSKNGSIEIKPSISSSIKLLDILKHPKFLFATIASMLDAFASSNLYVFLPFLLLKRGVSPALLGSFTAAFFVGNLFGKTALGRFVDRIGNAKVFIISELLMAICIFFLANSTIFFIIIGLSVVLGMFTKGTVPVNQTMISEAAEHHGNFEKAFGINGFNTSISVTLAPVLLGFISDKLSVVAAFNTMAVFALLAIVPAFCFQLMKKKRS